MNFCNMNILGIDFGKKRIGLAWMQMGLDVVLPFGIIEHKNAVAEIVRLCEAEKIGKIICGLPLGMDGKENANTVAVRDFVAQLKNSSVCPVEFIDERFSSAAADRISGDASRDEKAAMIILQIYLDRANS